MAEIIVENLKYRYPLTAELALNDLSFEINTGEFVGIIGANSAGKSTLCQALTGLVPQFYRGAFGGKVIVDGLNTVTSELYKLSSKVGIVFQNPFSQITGAKSTVYEEVAFGLESLGISRPEMIERIDWALNLLDIYQLKHRSPFTLSGGQMQRLAIASVIVMKPRILVFDEPTSQLDPQGSDEVFRVIQLLKKEGMTMVMAEHKVEKIARYADRVILLNKGNLIDYDSPSKIFSAANLGKYGVEAPVFTKICRRIDIRNKNTGLYPTTLEETYCEMVNEK